MVHSLPIICPIVPGLIGEVTAEEAAHLLASRLPAVEESSGGEVVELAVHVELPIWDYLLVWVLRQVAKALDNILCGDVSRRCYVQGSPPFLLGCCANHYVHSLRGRCELS